jgi:MoaA/NifB/PqqE/SkfB family radical SAM enzyme
MSLREIISIKDYRAFAGPDWPSYDQIINGAKSSNSLIQQEVDEFVSMMKQTWDELHLDGSLLASANQQRQQQMFFDKNYQGQPCTVPWNTMGINSNGEIYICESPSWVPKFVGNILKISNIYQALNSELARQIRQEILDGRYYYCNNTICNFFSKIDPKMYRHSGKEGHDRALPERPVTVSSMVSDLPRNLILDFDYTCNFQCPSCRTQVINNNKHHVIRPINDAIAKKVRELIIDKLGTAPMEIRWCGGEPFISEVYLELLDYIGSKHNNITHVIQTNGSYLQSKSHLVSKLLPKVRQLRISFDAATQQTYEKTRINGQWNQLLENVSWVVEHVQQHELMTEIVADFVVQGDNYKEIPQFVELCNQLGIKKINWQKMWNWGTWPQNEFDQKNIYNSKHPDYNELAKVFKIASQPMGH